VSIHHGVFPLRTRASQAESTLALEQFVDQFDPQAIPREVYEIQPIVDHRHVGDDIEYKFAGVAMVNVMISGFWILTCGTMAGLRLSSDI